MPTIPNDRFPERDQEISRYRFHRLFKKLSALLESTAVSGDSLSRRLCQVALRIEIKHFYKNGSSENPIDVLLF
ncbi:hypothetical protein TNCV_3676681 [Trichonephila clavipes]|nr:hypothetical protein TNCV_3676681 [Trichonephila clavipes]